MKASLILELFGEDARQLAKIFRTAFSASGGDFGEACFDAYVGVPPRSSWVAEITGPDEKYGLARSFLRCKIDYSHANGRGSRGIMAEFILSQGKIYEVKNQYNWSQSRRYFCTVDDEGDIIRLDEETVCHSMGILTREERENRKKTRIFEIAAPDGQYLPVRVPLDCDLSYSPGADDAVYPGYTLREGRIYEVREYLPRGRMRRYYCTVNDSGRVAEIDERDAYHAVGALTREERWELKRAEGISGDQRP